VLPGYTLAYYIIRIEAGSGVHPLGQLVRNPSMTRDAWVVRIVASAVMKIVLWR
jgi:hypothetical protein